MKALISPSERQLWMRRAARTALPRRGPSAPLQWLLKKGLIREDPVLDFGCGAGADVAHLQKLGFICEGYEPGLRWRCITPAVEQIFTSIKDLLPGGKYRTALAIYVLNTQPLSMEEEILTKLRRLVHPAGDIFAAVREGVRTGITSSGTFQRSVILLERDAALLHKTSSYRLYRVCTEPLP